MKNIFVFILFIAFILSAPTCLCSNLLVQAISSDDKDDLSAFFETLIRFEPFGYTIFGDKPISEACYSTKLKISNFIHPREGIYWKGEQLWHAYSLQSNIKNFFFKFQHTEDRSEIYLINKKSFLNVVEKNIDIFRDVLGHNLTAESLFLDLINDKNSFGHVLKNDQCLIGILFGYGYKSSQIFKKRDGSILEYEYLIKTVETSSIDTTQTLNLFPEVGFVADRNDTETQILLEKYEETKILIRDALACSDLLEAVLCKMTKD